MKKIQIFLITMCLLWICFWSAYIGYTWANRPWVLKDCTYGVSVGDMIKWARNYQAQVGNRLQEDQEEMASMYVPCKNTSLPGEQYCNNFGWGVVWTTLPGYSK